MKKSILIIVILLVGGIAVYFGSNKKLEQEYYKVPIAENMMQVIEIEDGKSYEIDRDSVTTGFLECLEGNKLSVDVKGKGYGYNILELKRDKSNNKITKIITKIDKEYIEDMKYSEAENEYNRKHLSKGTTNTLKINLDKEIDEKISVTYSPAKEKYDRSYIIYGKDFKVVDEYEK